MTSARLPDRRLAPWIVAACLLHLALAAVVTGWVLVDDAYITLRYARNAAQGVGLVYNAGEPVFGVTSPLWGVVTAVLYMLLGSATEVAITVGAVLLTGVSAALLARLLPARGRALGVAIFLLAPALVDNRLLGMETPLVVFLLLAGLCAAVEGRLVRAAGWTGLLLVSRPEGLLFAPFLLAVTARARGGWRSTLRDLARPAPAAAALGPGLAWAAWASFRYGSIVPQSMLAKSGWNSTHYDGLFGLEGALLTFPRLTFLPFVDRFPAPLPAIAAVAIVAIVVALVVVNVRRGDSVSRFGLASYLVYVGFYLVGKGATEASWYAVPSSVALLLAAGPALPDLRPGTMRLATAVLVVAAFGLSFLRAPLLHSYVEGYGRCADELNELPGEPRVVVGEIGVFGYRSRLPVTDVGALVSPEVLAWKNAGLSFVALVHASGAELFVISEIALQTNHYPSVGPVWADESERRWLDEACRLQCRYRDKLAFLVLPEPPLAR